MSNFEDAQVCLDRMAEGENATDIPECERAAIGYAKAAKVCVDEGFDSPNCREEIFTNAAKGAAIAYGVDPSVVDAAAECIESGGDSEICAKAGAKLAATAACLVITEGAGGPLCSKLAPFVVDAIWPIAGPPLVATWEFAWFFTSSVFEGLSGFAQGLLDFAGIDLSTDADPTVMEIYWDLLALGQRMILEQWEVAVEAVQAADQESKRELGFRGPMPFRVSVEYVDTEKNYAPGAVAELERWLRSEPMWVDPVYIVLRAEAAEVKLGGMWDLTPAMMGSSNYAFEIRSEPVINADMGSKDKRVNLGGMSQGMKKLTVASPKYIPGTYEIEEGEGWTPWNFRWDRFNNERKLLADAYLAALAVRVEGLKNATTAAVGSIIAENSSRAEASHRAQMLGEQQKGSIAVPLVVGTALVGALLGYSHWKNSKA